MKKKKKPRRGFRSFLCFIFFETRERKFSNRHTEELLLGNPKRKRERESRKVFGKKKESVPSTRIRDAQRKKENVNERAHLNV